MSASRKGGEAGELYVLGETIANVRLASGMTQEELGNAIRRSRIAVSQWEQGSRCPSMLDVCYLARACSVPPSAIFAVLDAFVLPPLPPLDPAKKPVNRNKWPIDAKRAKGYKIKR